MLDLNQSMQKHMEVALTQTYDIAKMIHSSQLIKKKHMLILNKRTLYYDPFMNAILSITVYSHIFLF